MVSEKLLSTRAWFILLFLDIISFTGSGIMIYHKNYLTASALMISGLIFIYLINKIYISTNEAKAFFFNSLRNDDTTLHFPSEIKNKSLADFYTSMNLLSKHFQEIKLKINCLLQLQVRDGV